MTKFKRIAAAMIAVATMATTSVLAFAGDGKSEDWAIDYTSGAPSSVSTQFVDRTLYYYTGGYQTTCNSFNGGRRWLYRCLCRRYRKVEDNRYRHSTAWWI